MIENFRPLRTTDGRWFVTVNRGAPPEYRRDAYWHACDLLTIIGWCDGEPASGHLPDGVGDAVVFDDRYGRARALGDLYDGSDGLGSGPDEVSTIYVTTPSRQGGCNGMRPQRGPEDIRPFDWTADPSWHETRLWPPRLAMRARSALTTYVAVREGWVKIGRTTNLDRRLVSLSTVGGAARPEGMTPGAVGLVFTFVGDVEDALHRRWAAFRVPGTEWFRLEGGFAEWVAMEEASLV